MVDECTIRRFEQRDLPRLHEIRKAAFKPVFASFRAITGEKIARTAFATIEQEQAQLLDSLSEESDRRELYVVERGNVIVAFCGLDLDESLKVGEIDLNAVDPTYQGQGIGTWMYTFALNRMKDAGMLVAAVSTGGDASHVPARRAYEKAGFGRAIPNVYYYKSLQE